VDRQDRREVAAVLIAYYPQLSVETAIAWVAEMLRFDRDTALEAVRRLARTHEQPSLAALLGAERLVLTEEASRRPCAAIASRAGEAEGSAERGMIYRQVAVDMVTGRVPKGTDFDAEVKRRLHAERDERETTDAQTRKGAIRRGRVR
jgi:hypothetical protein